MLVKVSKHTRAAREVVLSVKASRQHTREAQQPLCRAPPVVGLGSLCVCEGLQAYVDPTCGRVLVNFSKHTRASREDVPSVKASRQHARDGLVRDGVACGLLQLLCGLLAASSPPLGSRSV